MADAKPTQGFQPLDPRFTGAILHVLARARVELALHSQASGLTTEVTSAVRYASNPRGGPAKSGSWSL